MRIFGCCFARIVLAITVASALFIAPAADVKPDKKKSQAALQRGKKADDAGKRDEAIAAYTEAIQADRRLALMTYPQTVVVGSAQILALLAGISRDGVTMVAGMARGLSREDAARFAFLLATPVILAAGALKIPDLLGPLGSGIHGQVIFGSLLSGIGAYVSVRFLMRYFQTRTLTPFGIYCLVVGLGSLVYLGIIK